uniref:DRBM domain-containing protein n=1 Tax=Ananas comosus var. bracteatus TaxID=296719 RepID=A0A6V7PZV7_ANACO|nr:unnamed protein product [Ananas comosus var. bracteatus]
MYKNQLQELAQRSCFNLPSYTCIREGPDHAPRFKATVNFNGEVFESPSFCTTLRQAEHSAAEVALCALSHRGPSHSLAARILDETGVYKNLLQEVAQRVGAPLPSYTTVRSGLGHLPVFTCTVELAGITFTGEPAKNKKQAEKNAAMAAWSSLKQLAQQAASSSSELENNDEQEQIKIARALLNYRLKEKMAMAAHNPHISPFPKKFPQIPDNHRRPPAIQPQPSLCSKILPLIRPKSNPRARPVSPGFIPDNSTLPHKFPAAGAAPYVPIRQLGMTCHGMAPPVTIRTAVPVFSAPPLPPPPVAIMGRPPIRMASPVRIRPAVPVFAATPPVSAMSSVIPVQVKDVRAPVKEVLPVVVAPPPVQVQVKEPPPVVSEAPPAVSQAPPAVSEAPPAASAAPPLKETDGNANCSADTVAKSPDKSIVVEGLKQLEIK